MAIFIFCSNCKATRELRDIKKIRNSIKGQCKKCGAIISKNLSKETNMATQSLEPTIEIASSYNNIKSPIGTIYNNSSTNVIGLRNLEPIIKVDKIYNDFTSLGKIYNNSYSVIIGISRYKEEVSLSNAYNDASKINNILEKDYGFKNLVSPLFNENATKENIEEIFTDTIQNNEKIGTNDRLLIFYAGHGKLRRHYDYDRTEIREGYIIPYDSKRNKYSSNISMETITKSCQNCNAKHVLLILDCCYSGFAATRSSINDDYHHIDKKYLNDIASRRAIQVLAAGQDDQPVSDSGIRPGHSAFTGALLDILENQADLNKDGIISVREIAHYLETQVVKHTRGIVQRPLYNEIIGSRNGDFLFKIPLIY
jgi:hypothetical protein